MGHSVTLGGDKVGSGNKNKVYLHNYERSTHDLSTDFLSTMGCGMLIPFMCELVTRDDKYEIDLKAGLRTIPTKGPLFGSFKLQLDVYQYPLRLCQAILHNNPLAIGLKASQVKFPKMRLYGTVGTDPTKFYPLKSANNSLIKYLGISGIGSGQGNDNEEIWRDMPAFGVIGYYDIFKNYYANKQEEYAYTLKTGNVGIGIYDSLNYIFCDYWTRTDGYKEEQWINTTSALTGWKFTAPELHTDTNTINFNIQRVKQYDGEDQLKIEDLLDKKIILGYDEETPDSASGTYINKTLKEHIQEGRISDYMIVQPYDQIRYNIQLQIRSFEIINGTTKYLGTIQFPKQIEITNQEIVLDQFKLENIDKMRYDLLSFHQLGESYLLDAANNAVQYPYYSAIGDNEYNLWQEPLSGICVKTYQSDLYNNWLNTEIIDGENGINAITAISTSSGSITIDQIQFSEKLYNLLNRIAVSGNTYEDYLDAAYTASAKHFTEAPIWIGGMSDEVVFEEIVQMAPTEGNPLGALGGRGNLLGKTKGGKITVKIDEPSLLIGIVSITPRILYTQENRWFNTEIDSLADIHVPALDAIGFQNLIGEQLHFGSTLIKSDGTLYDRPIIGKVPAWINYMTNVDRAYGDFAATDGDGYMVLNRDYNCENGVIQDATTYIDPAKYNYAFAYTKREAQNFWVKIKCDIKARRLMSAKQIPTA